MIKRMRLTNFFSGKELDLMKAWTKKDRILSEKLISSLQTVNFLGNDGITPLLWFILKDNDSAFKLAVNMGADTNLASSDRITPLAALIENHKTELVEFLLKNGANPNITNRNGEPVLFTAIFKGYLDLVDLLLLWDADVNKTDCANKNSALYAAYLCKFDMAYRLLKHGADSDMKAKNGQNLKSIIERKLAEKQVPENSAKYNWLIKIKHVLDK